MVLLVQTASLRGGKRHYEVMANPYGCKTDEKLPIYGSLSVFNEPLVGQAEVVVAKETIVG